MSVNKIYMPFLILSVILISLFVNKEDVKAVCDIGQYSQVSAYAVAGVPETKVECNTIIEKVEMLNKNVGGDKWYLSFKNYLLNTAKIIAMIVKSGALIALIYSGIMYMRIVSDVKSIIAVKANIVSAFVALFLASLGGIIIDIFLGVIL